jgi:hypothetical protein
MKKTMRIVILLLTLALLAGGQALAQSRFDGSSGTSWNNADNWTPAGIPTTATPVIIGTTNAAVGAGGSPMTTVIGAGDACAAASLTLGELPFNSGTLDMGGGTLTIQTAGNITLGSAWGSAGMLNVADNGVVTNVNGLFIGNPGYGDAVVSGTGRVYAGGIYLSSTGGVASSLTVRDSGYAGGLFYVGYPDGIATVTLSNNATASGQVTYYTSIGTYERSIGRFYIRDNALYNGSGKNLHIGGGYQGLSTPNDRTGIVEVSESGVVTNCNIIIGNYGAGLMTVSGTGKVYSIVSMGSTGAVPCSLTVRDSGYVRNLGYIGQNADGAATVTLSNNATAGGWWGYYTCIGAVPRSTGRLYVRGNAVYDGANVGLYLGGHSAGVSQPNTCTGIVEVSDSGAITNCFVVLGDYGSGQMTVSGTGKVYASSLSLMSTGAVPCFLTVTNAGYVNGLYRIGGADGVATVTFSGDSTGVQHYISGSVGYGARATGRLTVRDNAVYNGNNSTTYIGEGSGSTGIVEVSGSGVMTNLGSLNIGTVAGASGFMTAFDSGKVYGPVTVGGGSTAGDRYGSVTISNAMFGGGMAATVWTNGFVELTGTGSVWRCSTFTCRGGTVTNHVRKVSGGLDITGTASSALVITNGGKVHLSFEEDPVVAGDFWGLRWAGNNHAGQLQALADSGALTWDVSALYAAYQGVGIYTNATDTMVGVYVKSVVPRGLLLIVQ